jgi:hypothetical protein
MASGFELPEKGTGGGRGMNCAGVGEGGFGISFFFFCTGLYGFILERAAAMPMALATSSESSYGSISISKSVTLFRTTYTFSKLGRLTGPDETPGEVCCESATSSLVGGMTTGGTLDLGEGLSGSEAGDMVNYV